LENSFHYKLHSILEQGDFKETIAWDLEGQKFEIKNPEKLIEEVLPAFFSHKKFSSFTRQLSFYGFKSQKDSNGPRWYYHAYCQRENRNLLARMGRKKAAKAKSIVKELDQPVQITNQHGQITYRPKSDIEELLHELACANRMISCLQSENRSLRCEVTNFNYRPMKNPAEANIINLPTANSFLQTNLPSIYRGPEHRFGGFGGFGAPQDLMTYTSNSNHGFSDSNERETYEEFEEVPTDTMEFNRYIEMTSENPNYENYDQQSVRGEENIFSHFGDERNW